MRLTEAEWQIMNALWSKHPATARQISMRLPEGIKWAYTTVKTMLTRLAEKKAVSEAKQGNTSQYEPLISQNKARRSALKSLVNQAFDGTFGPLMHFLAEQENLSENQRTELIQLLQKHNHSQIKGN